MIVPGTLPIGILAISRAFAVSIASPASGSAFAASCVPGSGASEQAVELARAAARTSDMRSLADISASVPAEADNNLSDWQLVVSFAHQKGAEKAKPCQMSYPQCACCS